MTSHALEQTHATPETYTPPESTEQLGQVFDFMHAAQAAGRELSDAQYFLSGATQGAQIELPPEVYRALQQVVDAMRRGLSVTVIPVGKTVTTQDAADLLGISRPTVVKLIDRGELPHEMVGTHRRILLDDVLTYQRERRRRQYDSLADITTRDEPSQEAAVKRLRKARKKLAEGT